MQTKPLEVKKARNADYKLLNIAKKFKPVGPEKLVGTCANIKYDIQGEMSLENFDEWYAKTFAAQTSAPYVLARLCALFEGLQIDVGGQEFYKVTWQTVLEHTSGHVVTFYDWKGGISYGSDVAGKSAPKSFIRDVKRLLKVLSDDRCPHPYDGCAVGEIA